MADRATFDHNLLNFQAESVLEEPEEYLELIRAKHCLIKTIDEDLRESFAFPKHSLNATT
jgi:hypothetical protein